MTQFQNISHFTQLLLSTAIDMAMNKNISQLDPPPDYEIITFFILFLSHFQC